MINVLFRARVFFIFAVVTLAGCVTQTTPFFVPERVVFQGQNYIKVTDNQLDEMQHLLYLPENSPKNANSWDKGILFFLDKNSQGQTLEQRAAFRQSSFAKQQNVRAKFSIQQNELQSSVIYPATQRFNNVMLEATRGRNLDCGYGQIQVSDKRKINHRIAKNAENLTAYIDEMMKLALSLNKMQWLIECR